MNKTFEIGMSTIIKITLVVIGFIGVIYLLNTYDRNKKNIKLKEKIAKLDKLSVIKDLSKQLDTVRIDHVDPDFIQSIHDKIVLVNDEIENKYSFNSQLISKNEEGFTVFKLRGKKFEKVSSIKKSTSDVINALEDNKDVFLTNRKENTKNSSKKIVYPLSKTSSGNWYLSLPYVESR